VLNCARLEYVDLAIFLGIGAFVILGIMVLLLWLSSRKDTTDPVTQEIIVKANTGPVIIHAPVDATQEDKD
jgi:ABC-type transporter Mla subunit MlaD